MACVVISKDPSAKRVGFGPGDQLVDTRSWGNWHLYRRRWLIWNTSGKPSDGGYDIDLWDIDSHKELVDWLFHVGGKTYDPEQFFDAMRDIFGSAGYSDTVDGKALAIKFWERSVPHNKRIHKELTSDLFD